MSAVYATGDVEVQSMPHNFAEAWAILTYMAECNIDGLHILRESWRACTGR